ncbi:hypothetical protein QE152_g33196 [Popillia japonica]|uniref:Peptidase S1 domain-containing protein n=1 Tax=Popillia japonica TaxID=7064 RepID=A0AAW1IXT9_POPJA
MNVLYGILLLNLLLTPISGTACNSSFIGRWDDQEIWVYCTGAIVRVPGYHHHMVIANYECLKHYQHYAQIRLVKCVKQNGLMTGDVTHLEVRDNFILMSASPLFINATEYIEFYSRGDERSSHLVYLHRFTLRQLAVQVHPRPPEKRPFLEDKFCMDGHTSYDNYNNFSINGLKCYKQEKSIQQETCQLNRGYLVVNYKLNVLFGIGLPMGECHNSFNARYIRYINLTGIVQYQYYSAFPKITISYTCMVVAFSAVVVL